MQNMNHPAASAIDRKLAGHGRARALLGSSAEVSSLNRLRDDPLIEAFRTNLIEKGVSEGSIRKSGAVALPGAYDDSTRKWDLVVMENDELVAAIEFKSLIDSSAGKNIRNRMSDALALAADFGRAYSTSARRPFRPLLGLVFVLEESAASTSPTRSAPYTSYVDRCRDFSRRLLDDEMYDAIAYLTFTGPSPVAVTEPDPAMGFETLAQSVADHVTAFRKLREHHDPAAASIALRLSLRDDLTDVLSALSDTDPGHMAVEEAGDEIALKRRRAVLQRLRQIITDPDAPESALQEAIGRHYWLFGGQYQAILPRRDLMPLQQHDIPLVCADRSIHIVELKKPGARLVTRHTGTQLIVSTAVHEAVNQCMNYIRTFDQAGATMQTLHRNELGFDVDYLRAKGTVVIGNLDHVRIDGVTREMVEQTIRSYNAHLSRVQVLSYTDLVESAERALRFTEE